MIPISPQRTTISGEKGNNGFFSMMVELVQGGTNNGGGAEMSGLV